MHHDTLDPQTGNEYKYKNCKKACGKTYKRIDGNIIMPLKGIEPVACVRMLCAQLRDARWIAKTRRGRQDGQRDRAADKLDRTPLGGKIKILLWSEI